MKKEEDNSFGVSSVILGILGIVFAGLPGLILGIISIVFASKQEKYQKNKWSKAGKILGIIAIILGIAVIAINIWILKNTDLISQLISQSQYVTP